MWCPRCKTETTVAGSRSSQDARCGACGSTLQASKTSDAPKSSDTTIRQARDIIARWSSSDLLDQISALPPLPPLPKPHFPRLTDPVDSFRSSYRAASRPQPQPEAEQHWSDPSDEQHSTTARFEQQADQEQKDSPAAQPAAAQPDQSMQDRRFENAYSKHVHADDTEDSESDLSEHAPFTDADRNPSGSIDLEFGDDEDTDADFADAESVGDATAFEHAPYSLAAVVRSTAKAEPEPDSDASLSDQLDVPPSVFRQDTAVPLMAEQVAADDTTANEQAHSEQQQPSLSLPEVELQDAQEIGSEPADTEPDDATQLSSASDIQTTKPDASTEASVNADNTSSVNAVGGADEGNNADDTQLADDTLGEANVEETMVAAGARRVAVVALLTEAVRPRPRLTDVLKPFFKRRAKPEAKNSNSSDSHHDVAAANDAPVASSDSAEAESSVLPQAKPVAEQPLDEDNATQSATTSKVESTDQTSLETQTPGGSDPPARRRPLTRAEQPRQSRERAELTRPPRKPNLSSHNKTSAAALNEGQKPVTRKFRVDRPGGEEIQPEQIVPTNVAGARIQSNSSSSGRRYRIDDGEPAEATLNTADRRVRTQHRPRQRYIDDAHESAVRGPHFQVTAPKRSNLTSMTGQFLAYLGVLGLTIGTAIVIYGHFGGYSDYTPTGWLVTTVAQMMLFLGVINLVSGGIEQTNDDVSARINTLGEQLMRIEQVTEQALRGPKISAQRYAQPDSEAAEHESDLVPTRERQ